MTISTSSITSTDLIKKGKSALAMSWLTKGQKAWYNKCYSEEQWLEAIGKAKIIQSYYKTHPDIDPHNFILTIIRKEIKRKVSPVHIALYWILAGEPFKQAYYSRLGDPFFLNRDLAISNFYTMDIILEPITFHTDWTQYQTIS